MKSTFSEEFTLSKNNINIKKENILKSLQVPLGHNDPYVESIIDSFITQSLTICSPRCQYVIIETPVFKNNIEMEVGGQNFMLDKIVLSAVKKSSHIAFFIGTAGNEIEQFSKQLMREGNPLEGLIVNLIGSEIAEEVADFIHKKIGNNMALQGMNITNRYSPGYCNWSVSDQQKLFNLFEGKTSGIQLTESSLMIPIKSVSGIIGVGVNVKNRSYSCSVCNTEFCIYRDKNN